MMMTPSSLLRKRTRSRTNRLLPLYVSLYEAPSSTQVVGVQSVEVPLLLWIVISTTHADHHQGEEALLPT